MPTGSTARPTAQRTRDALLHAAYAEFTQYGPAGARVDRIADRAGCNKQRIYAYFKSKENLFGEVMREAHRQLALEVPLPSDRSELDEYVGKVFDFHYRDPSVVRLLAWEGLTYGQAPLPWAEERRTFYEAKLDMLRKAIGVVDPPVLAALLIELIAIASWPFVVPQQRRLLYEAHRPGLTTVESLRDSLNALGRASIASVAKAP
jgi:AcrR family transcriptional regulator